MTMRAGKINFEVSDEIRKLGIQGAYFTVQFDPTKADPSGIATVLTKTQQTIRSNALDLANDTVLFGYRALHKKVGISNRKHIASPENLLGLIRGGRDLPSINPIVDTYNIVSLETKVALGAHDTSQITGPIGLRLTTGTEDFTPLGSSEKKVIDKGEYAYIDEGRNELICRLETRQGTRTKVTKDSRECFFIVQSNEATDCAYISNAVEKLERLLGQYCGASDISDPIWIATELNSA